jgi:hypothetical protein
LSAVAFAMISAVLVFHKVSVPPHSTDPTAAQRLQLQIQNMPGTRGRTQVLRLDQAELNLFVKSMLEQSRHGMLADTDGKCGVLSLSS